MKLSKQLDNILTKIYGCITITFLKIYRFSRAMILDILLLTYSDIQKWRPSKQMFPYHKNNFFADNTLTALGDVVLKISGKFVSTTVIFKHGGFECRRTKLFEIGSPENLYFDTTLMALCGVVFKIWENWFDDKVP